MFGTVKVLDIHLRTKCRRKRLWSAITNILISIRTDFFEVVDGGNSYFNYKKMWLSQSWLLDSFLWIILRNKMTQKPGCDITGWFIYTMANSPVSLFGDITWPSPSRTENTRISIIFLVYQVLGANKTNIRHNGKTELSSKPQDCGK